MRAIEGFCDVRTELTDLNKEAVELAVQLEETFGARA